LFLPTRGAGLIAVRPTDCTGGGVKEQAGCRMECEGFCVGSWNTVISFSCFSVGSMYELKNTVVLCCREHEMEFPPNQLFFSFGKSLEFRPRPCRVSCHCVSPCPFIVSLLAALLTRPHFFVFFFPASGTDGPRRRLFALPSAMARG
ncbi:regulator of sigma E protease, partial [Trypanosoma cruzi]